MESPQLILASGSSIRKELLTKAGVQFECIPSNINEDLFDPLDATERAIQKAMAVSKQYNNAWVIGADQICHLNGEVFHKPLTKPNAIQTLKKLSGNTHTLLTAVAMVLNGIKHWSHLETIQLKMKPLSIKTIVDYVDTDNPIYSCGAYQYEANGHALFETVSHSSDAIQGLPLEPLMKHICHHIR